jgi:hypothetical protein
VWRGRKQEFLRSVNLGNWAIFLFFFFFLDFVFSSTYYYSLDCISENELYGWMF